MIGLCIHFNNTVNNKCFASSVTLPPGGHIAEGYSPAPTKESFLIFVKNSKIISFVVKTGVIFSIWYQYIFGYRDMVILLFCFKFLKTFLNFLLFYFLQFFWDTCVIIRERYRYSSYLFNRETYSVLKICHSKKVFCTKKSLNLSFTFKIIKSCYFLQSSVTHS